MKALQELEEQRELEKYNMPIRSHKDRANPNRGKVVRNSRLPHVLFASTLEQVGYPRNLLFGEKTYLLSDLGGDFEEKKCFAIFASCGYQCPSRLFVNYSKTNLPL